MVRSYWELGDILHFDPDTARRNVELGYYDTLRAFGRVRGCAYAVDNSPDSSADAAAFRARFDAVQKAVREKYPVTLTADAALLLARMKDAELAPLETVAEDVGVDPRCTTPPGRWGRRSWSIATRRAWPALPRCLQAARTPRPGGAGSPAAQYILAGAGLAGPDRAGTAGGDRT